MRPWSRTTSCWRCSCAAQMRASLEGSVRLLAHPKSVTEIASVGPIKRKLIEEYRLLAAGKNQKRDGIWPYSTLRVQRRKGAVISPAARICPRRSTFWPCARRPLERRHESAKTEARRRIQIPPLLFRWRALNMASLTIPHRDLFKSSLSDRRKGITCPSKYLILAVDTPDSSV